MRDNEGACFVIRHGTTTMNSETFKVKLVKLGFKALLTSRQLQLAADCIEKSFQKNTIRVSSSKGLTLALTTKAVTLCSLWEIHFLI